MRTVRVGGFFTGIGAHVSACERLSDRAEFIHVFQCEVDGKTAQQFDTIHGQIPNLGDITKVHDIGGDLQVDILYWTPPCIRKGDKVLTGCGYVPIEEVEAGDSVLSHDGKWHDVEWAGKTGDKKVLSIKTELGSTVGATEDHLFYACRCVDGKLTEPEWVQAKDLTTAHYLGRPPAYPVMTRAYSTEWQWSRICHIHRDPRIHEVYDLTVQDAHSFIVNGVVVHNCQDISNAGKQQGNKKGSGTRSSLAYEVPRILANTEERERGPSTSSWRRCP